MLKAALLEADLTVPELWLRYFGLGGTATPEALEDHIEGRFGGVLDDGQHDTVVQARNERFMDLHLDHPLPYRRG
jgi:hypothetical protein